MKRVLVTGANGFVGRSLCRRLLAEGCEVTGLVRRPENAASLPAGTTPICCAVDEGMSGLDLSGMDGVVHLAGRAHILRETAVDPAWEIKQANVVLTSRLAQAATTSGVKRFIFMSTAKVYGDCSTRPFDESSPPSPRDAYAASKLEAEERLRAMAASAELALTIIRPPLVYGPGVKANFLHLLRLATLPLPLPLGGINNRRSFIFLDNLVDGIVSCLRQDRAVGETFCISDGEDLSTSDLLCRVGAAMGKRPRLFRLPEASCRRALTAFGLRGHYERLWGSLQVDSSKMARTLGWRPPYDVNHGLAATASWFLEHPRKMLESRVLPWRHPLG